MHKASQDPKYLVDVNIIICLFFFFLTASLTCFSDKMRAIISKSYLASLKYSENNLQLSDPTCRPRISNVVDFSIPLNGCGTIKKVKLSWILSNAGGVLDSADSAALAGGFNEKLPSISGLIYGKLVGTDKCTHSFTHQCQITTFIFRVTGGWLSFPKCEEL